MNLGELFGFAEENDALKKENTAELKALGDAARSCVNTKEFQNYKKKLEKTRLTILDELVAMRPQGTLEQYGMQVMIYLDRYRTLTKLISAVEIDAKKGKD